MALLFCCGTLNYADRTAMSSVFPLLQRDLGLTDLALGAKFVIRPSVCPREPASAAAGPPTAKGEALRESLLGLFRVPKPGGSLLRPAARLMNVQ